MMDEEHLTANLLRLAGRVADPPGHRVARVKAEVYASWRAAARRRRNPSLRGGDDRARRRGVSRDRRLARVVTAHAATAPRARGGVCSDRGTAAHRSADRSDAETRAGLGGSRRRCDRNRHSVAGRPADRGRQLRADRLRFAGSIHRAHRDRGDRRDRVCFDGVRLSRFRDPELDGSRARPGHAIRGARAAVHASCSGPVGNRRASSRRQRDARRRGHRNNAEWPWDHGAINTDVRDRVGVDRQPGCTVRHRGADTRRVSRAHRPRGGLDPDVCRFGRGAHCGPHSAARIGRRTTRRGGPARSPGHQRTAFTARPWRPADLESVTGR